MAPKPDAPLEEGTLAPTTATPIDDDGAYEGLTEQEAEGLREFDEMLAANAPEAIDLPPTEDDEDDEDDDDGAVAAATPDPTPAATPDPVKAAADPAPAPKPIDFSTKMQSAKAAMQAAQDSLDEIQTKYDDGDLDETDYRAQRREAQSGLSDAQTDLSAFKTLQQAQASTLEQAQATSAAEADRQWAEASTSFASANPEFVAPAHHEGFNKIVRYYTRTDSPYADMPFDAVLTKAAADYADYCATKGIAPPTLAAAEALAPPGAKLPTAAPKASAAPPVTLRDVPSEVGDPHQSAAAQWAALIEKTTDADELDEIWAKMPKEIEDRVLQYGAS